MNSKPKVLVVDDDRSIGGLMDAMLEMEGYPRRIVSSGAQARKAISEESFDIVVSDIYLGDASGLDLLELAKDRQPDAEVVIMTAQGSVETAVRAVRLGAFDYVSKPFPVETMLEVLRRIEEKRAVGQTVPPALDIEEPPPGTEIIGTSPRMVEVYKKVAKVSAIDAPVLVLGESGSGKELIARAIHASSPRASQPFIVINCGALPETLLESELFGHERGSFTGANAARRGLLESASGGTVFLDEISETSLGFQVKLLRVIQEREIRRVGSNETIQVNIRVIAATNRDLREMMRLSRFREDLFHRLNVFTVPLPPLRDRPTDIVLLANHFLKGFNAAQGKVIRFAPETMESMGGYAWPGNVRELRNFVERAVTFNDTGVISASAVEFADAPSQSASPGPTAQDSEVSPTSPEPPAGSSLESMERDHIIRVLRETGGNKKKAAEVLGIERRTLYNKAKRLGIDFKSV
jgi:two-component system response regulator AtoC